MSHSEQVVAKEQNVDPLRLFDDNLSAAFQQIKCESYENMSPKIKSESLFDSSIHSFEEITTYHNSGISFLI